MNAQKILGRNIASHRKKAHKSAEEVADFLGCSVNTVYKYEQGERPIYAWQIFQLAYFFNIDIGDFFQGITFCNQKNKPQVLIKDVLKKPQVLVIEDDPSDVYILKKALDFCKLKVDLHCFSSVEEAKQFLHNKNESSQSQIDLILVDINLRGASGIEFIRVLRKNQKFSQTPIIVITNDNSRKTLDIATQVGATSYIVKTHKPDEMVKTISQVFMYWCQTTYLSTRVE